MAFSLGPFPFPTSVGGAFPPKDGFFIKTPSIFRSGARGPHEKFLQDVPHEEKLFRDPMGFTALPFLLEEQWIVICGIRVNDFCDRKKTNAIIGKDFNPIMPKASLMDMLNAFRNTARPTGESPDEAAEGRAREFVSVTMHEIRALNLQIKAQAEEVIESLARQLDKSFVGYRSENIFATSSLISTRLDAYDFHVNPSAFTAEKPKPAGVHKKFQKVAHCLNVLCRQKSVYLKLQGQSFASMAAYPIFDILPFVVLENAIKYSPSNQQITVSFSSEPQRVVVTVESIGPMLRPGEEAKLGEHGFRGLYAEQLKKQGSGLGLHFAKLVCKLHNIELQLACDPKELVTVSGIPYSRFNVRFIIPSLTR